MYRFESDEKPAVEQMPSAKEMLGFEGFL